ncbi:hypothetical protein [Bradyrhizobium liaoningense]|uniref:hypothetical protein n=1 Tax=Bradyrhizobium liaoningense TaxID=43992 RepID=UPI001BAB090F|nr:hypothetical protein [Bradyrhizobium liaoningense]MBR0823490.1 hypothetical protein [Bradyrhizobium liaoningense]
MGTKGATYLGMDGGGTRCRARIENGGALGEASSGPATEAAAAQSGLTHEDFARMHAGIGLAGIGHPVRLALRAADRRGELTLLLSELLGAFDQDPYQAVAWSEEAKATDYAAFAPTMMRHASQGDPVGRRIVERVADAIGDLPDLFLARGIDRLALVGGLADATTPWLTPDLRARLRRPDAAATAGALLLTRGRLDLPKMDLPKMDLPKRETDHEQASKFRVS